VSGDRKHSDSAADIARRIQRMTLLVRGEARSLMHLRPASGNLVAEFGPRGASGAAAGPRQKPGATVGQPFGQEAGHGGHAQPGKGSGWWVLAQGAPLDPENFSSRETAREELLDAVRRAGVLVPENIWVWDEAGRAQLVLATLPTEERALRVAERLREKGLAVIVRREMP
jgi:hypothetical protein